MGSSDGLTDERDKLASNQNISDKDKSDSKYSNEGNISEKRQKYRQAWKIINESGLDEKIMQIPGIYLRLSCEKTSVNISSDGKIYTSISDVPQKVITEYNDKKNKIDKIIQELKILDRLSMIGVTLNIHITGSYIIE